MKLYHLESCLQLSLKAISKNDLDVLLEASAPVSDEETLSSIKLKIGSNQPIKKAERGLYRLIITSEELVTDLLRLGVPTSDLWAEMEREDVWLGMKQTHCYRRFSDGVCQFRTKQSKVALWVRDRFSGQIITQS